MTPPRNSRQYASIRERKQHIETTLFELSALAKLDSIRGFADAVVWAQEISSTRTASMQACTADDGGDVESYGELLKMFYLAISNGYKQLLLNWPQQISPAAAHAPYDATFLAAVKTVFLLSRVLCHCKVMSWYKEEHRIKEVDAAIKAGKSAVLLVSTAGVLRTSRRLPVNCNSYLRLSISLTL